ncbi:CshA/CshB family fibrillar adhesin-related protein, partial [Streptococcus sp. sy004]|uniref:CshA/CshB family fibrillar adhesin-related protein n=1 Tax=Streptococcus sp. sy004 TaxID=2600149 RepID=UPI0011B8E09C
MGNQAARFASSADGSDVDVKLRLERIVNGVIKPANIIVADGEQLTNRELITFTTDGSPWELLGEYKRGNNSWIPNTPTLYNDGVVEDGETSPYGAGGYAGNAYYPVGTKPNPQAFLSSYPNSGIGTQILSSTVNYLHSYPGRNGGKSLSVPVFSSENVSELGIYINSAGKQSALIGFLIFDESDAPDSYGKAVHGIAPLSGSGESRQIPQLGRAAADIDKIEDLGTNPFYEDDDTVGENGNTLVDEGEDQLAANRFYEVVNAGSSTYTLSVVANANGPATASAKAWIDFNNDGVFESYEASEIQTFSGTNQTILNFTWSNLNLANLNPDDVQKLAARIRIGSETDVANAIGIASTGEVEDFQVMIKYPPKGSEAETSGYAGQSQTGTVTFTSQGKLVESDVLVRNQQSLSNSMIAALDTNKIGIVNPDTGNIVQSLETSQGLYTVLPSSTGSTVQVQFTPKSGFVGRADGVVIRSTDSSGLTSGWTSRETMPNTSNLLPVGQTWDSLYIPTVINLVPTATPRETEGPQGKTQTTDATSMFTPGTDGTGTEALDQSSLTLLDSSDNPVMSVSVTEGTYTLANGIITFKPNPDFVGTATPVKVRMSDMSGDSVTTTYTPMVTPAQIMATDDESTGVQGATQKGQITSSITNGNNVTNSTYTFDGGKTTKTVPGEGTYTVNPKTGEVTFVPDPNFVGTATPVTSFVDEDGNVISPNEDGKQPSKDISGYKLVGSSTDENGNVVHTYRKVVKSTTSFVDGDGNPILPNEEGNVPSKDIPGYEIVSSTTDANGNTVHTYRKVTTPVTSFVDEDGNVISPNEDGKQPSKAISGYELVGSSTDENGNVVYTYRKVVKTTTSFVDGDGNPILPNEEGNVPSK